MNTFSFISRHYCNESVCENGIYTPERCKKTNCAVLLAPHYNVTKFVIQHIDEMELYVKVVWLGSNLKQVVDKLVMKYPKQLPSQSLLILGWTPSAFINPESNFIRVEFKRCELLNSSHTVGCKYEMNRLIKTSWSKLEQIAKPAYEALHRITFSQKNYDDLLHQYNLLGSNQTIYDIACNWMLDNEKTWLNWIPGKIFLYRFYEIHLLDISTPPFESFLRRAFWFFRRLKSPIRKFDPLAFITIICR